MTRLSFFIQHPFFLQQTHLPHIVTFYFLHTQPIHLYSLTLLSLPVYFPFLQQSTNYCIMNNTHIVVQVTSGQAGSNVGLYAVGHLAPTTTTITTSRPSWLYVHFLTTFPLWMCLGAGRPSTPTTTTTSSRSSPHRHALPPFPCVRSFTDSEMIIFWSLASVCLSLCSEVFIEW